MEFNLTDPHINQELLTWYDTITKQNLLLQQEQCNYPEWWISDGSPIFWHPIRDFLTKHITHLTQKHEIIKYFRHVDDMLLIFDSNHTNIQDILTDLNTIHPNVHFTAETEHNNKIKYLDISIHKTAHNISLANYRHYHPLLFQPHHTR